MQTKNREEGDARSDRELLRRLKQSPRCPVAFAAIVRRHTDMVYACCTRVLQGAYDDRTDAMQAVFLALFQRAHTLREDTELGAWLHRVAVLTSLQIRRERQRRIRREETAVAIESARNTTNPETGDVWESLKPHLDGAVSELPAKYREVVVLRFLEGLSRKQVAERLQCSEGTVRTRLTRALHRLRRKLAVVSIMFSESRISSMLQEGAIEHAPPALADQLSDLGKSPSRASPVATTTAATVCRRLFWSGITPILASAIVILAIGASIPVVYGLMQREETQKEAAPETEKPPREAWLDHCWSFEKGPQRDLEVRKGQWEWSQDLNGRGIMSAEKAVLLRFPVRLSRRPFKVEIKGVKLLTGKRPIGTQLLFCKKNGERVKWRSLWRAPATFRTAAGDQSLKVWFFDSHVFICLEGKPFAILEYASELPGEILGLSLENLSTQEITLRSVKADAIPPGIRSHGDLKKQMVKWKDGNAIRREGWRGFAEDLFKKPHTENEF